MTDKLKCYRGERERPSVWFTPQMGAAAKAGPGQRQEPRASSRLPMLVLGPKDLDHPLLLFQEPHKGIGLEVKHLGDELLPVWDACDAGGG